MIMKCYYKTIFVVVLALLIEAPLLAQVIAQKQFAHKVEYVSREYNSYPDGWCAAQMLGVPNVYPEYGDIEEAWTPASYGDQRDTVILSFWPSSSADSLFIYETNSPGFIDSVWVSPNATFGWALVYSAVPSFYGDTSRLLSINIPSSVLALGPIKYVKFTVATDMAQDYVEVDAVALSNPSPTLAPSVPGNSIAFDGINDKFQTLTPAKGVLGLEEKSITAWVKVDGIAPVESSVYDGDGIIVSSDAYAGIYHTNLNGADSIYFYSYNSSSYYFGMDYMPGEWMHIAYVHGNDTLSAYKNGVLYRSIYCPETEGFYGGFIEIGYNDYDDNYFEGEIESVSIYDFALSKKQVREAMHITPPLNTPGLVAHYDFNKSNNFYESGLVPNIVGSPGLIPSKLPIGPGIASSANEITGMLTFPGTGFAADYTNQNAGEVTVSKVDYVPFAAPTGFLVDSAYWVVNQFSGTSFLADFEFNPMLPVDPGQAECHYLVYHREVVSASNWTLIDTAVVTSSGYLSVANMDETMLGQYAVIRTGNCSGIGLNEQEKEQSLIVYPNPSAGLTYINITAGRVFDLQVFDAVGQRVMQKHNLEGLVELELKSGIYILQFSSQNEATIVKRLIVR
jgi:hypothetical protein